MYADFSKQVSLKEYHSNVFLYDSVLKQCDRDNIYFYADELSDVDKL